MERIPEEYKQLLLKQENVFDYWAGEDKKLDLEEADQMIDTLENQLYILENNKIPIN